MSSFAGFNFLKLVLEERPKNRISVVVVKETAEYFGWDKAFPEWTPPTHIGSDGKPRRYARSTSKCRHYRGGDRLRICRVASTGGNPAGYTHSFRLVGAWSRKHLAALAQVAGDKFEWMENASYQRMKRDYWLSLAPIR